ncbi:TIGR03943 family putative permease subunit [Cohnella zeiphila]|uniref:TIGR03943 family protein n=1 Tax=Cohnella zeiphila TaxID=2761120 RepID=A0A7X0SLU8_9BACL|nr:TIGR03943 family protein [Cohnella zeiphila]MBB6732395.1 TIGR03943 family protein [Cohnella zeiphila]
MMRFAILFGFAFMFFLLHYTGDIDKYINMKYAYLSISAIVMLTLLSLYDFIRGYIQDRAAEKKAESAAARGAGEQAAEASSPEAAAALAAESRSVDGSGLAYPAPVPADAHARARHQDHEHDHRHAHEHDHDHKHANAHDHDHAHEHAHAHAHAHGSAFDDHGHSHGESSRFKRYAGYLILLFPIFTGIFLPVQTLDSSFVTAKGFSFPTLEEDVKNNPGYHQFLRPSTSMFYNPDDYNAVKKKEIAQFSSLQNIVLDDEQYLKGMEAIYNEPSVFMGKTITFNGFAYKGKQVDGDHYFVFRFGFIHCVADSGVFGMLVKFPPNANLKDDDWVQVSGKLSWEYYQPFKATIPVLNTTSWSRIDAPKEPYVYRNF